MLKETTDAIGNLNATPSIENIQFVCKKHIDENIKVLLFPYVCEYSKHIEMSGIIQPNFYKFEARLKLMG